MGKLQIMTKLMSNRSFAKAALAVKRNWPTICLVAGITSGVGAAVGAGVQTAKLEPILDNHKERMNAIKEKASSDGYSDSDRKKDTAKEYIKTAGKVAKLYAIPVALEAVSVASQISGHNTLKAENLAIAAAYTSTIEAFKAYRKKVKESEGELKDLEYQGLDIQEQEVDDDGKTTSEKIVLMDSRILSPYCRIFDCGNSHWSENPENNMFFLKTQMVEANRILHSRGWIFLNEVFDLLDMPWTEAGQHVGWVDGMGDNFVDFGMYSIKNKNALDGYEPAIWLDFNVDGDINYIFKFLHEGKMPGRDE